jgi:hypothetical protein
MLVTIGPDDPRYADLAVRHRNDRHIQRPRCFHVVRDTEETVAAVTDAVRRGLRVAVRSGGHSLENSVGEDPESVVIDMSEMNRVRFDPLRGAFMVESGAELGSLQRTLYLNWGVTAPVGYCPTVCAGGHVMGGGYGALSRAHGSVVDHLEAVEVVVVDAVGRAHAVVAARGGPHEDLWWAHTGGGGGNFGVVTRYWLRSPDRGGDDPTMLLPRPPASLRGGTALWSWDDLTPDSFHRLMNNHAEWHEKHSGPDSPFTTLSSTLMVSGRTARRNPADVLVHAQVDGSRAMLDSYLNAVSASVGGRRRTAEPVPWLSAAVPLDTPRNGAEYDRYKGKAGYLRRGFRPAQVDTVYRHLSAGPPTVDLARLWLVSYGGRVNAVDPTATALVQRDSILKAAYTATWSRPEDDAANLAWIRRFYRDVYAETGGVPVPDDVNDGSYINYPDTDLADPDWNTSGVPWHHLYYKENYPRLQRVKRDWDPLDTFRHTLSVRPA